MLCFYSYVYSIIIHRCIFYIQRKDINTVAEVKSTELQSCGRKHAIKTTIPDPTYDAATRKYIVMTTNTESVAVRPNPAYSAIHGVYTTVTQESLVSLAMML